MITEREKQILVLLAEGKMQKQIAHKFGCTEHNIVRICIQLRERFGCFNTTQLVAYAITHQLITIENCIGKETEGR